MGCCWSPRPERLVVRYQNHFQPNHGHVDHRHTCDLQRSRSAPRIQRKKIRLEERSSRAFASRLGASTSGLVEDPMTQIMSPQHVKFIMSERLLPIRYSHSQRKPKSCYFRAGPESAPLLRLMVHRPIWKVVRYGNIEMDTSPHTVLKVSTGPLLLAKAVLPPSS